MRINNLEHVGVLVDNVEKSIEGLKKVFGIEKSSIIDWKIKKDLNNNPIEPYTLRMGFVQLANTVIEFMQVLEGKSFYDNYKEKVGEGIHHICMNVEDIDEAIKHFEELGIKVADSGKVAGSAFAYLDTIETCGFLIEVLQKKVRKKKV